MSAKYFFQTRVRVFPHSPRLFRITLARGIRGMFQLKQVGVPIFNTIPPLLADAADSTWVIQGEMNLSTIPSKYSIDYHGYISI